MSKIAGGYFIMARAIQNSDIAKASPCTRELWTWLIKEANHKLNSRSNIKRGSMIRTIKNMQEGLHWYSGYRRDTYTKSQIEYALKYLRDKTMIKTAKTTRGMLITICNYERYQDFKNYEPNNESDNEPRH